MFFEEKEYINLEISKNSSFKRLNSLEINNGKINIMDHDFTKKVFVFDDRGNFLRSIGRKGKGPGEYILLQAFDVDEKQDYYLLNAQKKKLIVHDSLGRHKRTIPMEFRANDLVRLQNGGFIFFL